MKKSEDAQLFTEKAEALLIREMKEKGILGEWEEPLCLNCIAVKNSSSEYFTNLVGYEVLLIDNSTRTDRVLYNPERYTEEQAIEYGDGDAP